MSDQLAEMRRLAVAIKRRDTQDRIDCFDPEDLSSRPTAEQLAVLTDTVSKEIHCMGGNQCLDKNTQILTPSGPVTIDSLRVGDTVYDEHGRPIKVLQVFDQGVQDVVDLTYYGDVVATCTTNHVWLSDHKRRRKPRQVAKFGRDTKICQQFVKAPLGNVSQLHAYAIGALLGDGCCRQGGQALYISSETAAIPARVASVMGGTYRKQGGSNYTWSISGGSCEHYTEWLKGRYAHEKIIDLDTVKTWDRASVLQFVAGAVDTDGSVYRDRTNQMIYITVGMQAGVALDVLAYCFQALWQVTVDRLTDDRLKYKNGPVHVIRVGSQRAVKRIMEELAPHLSVEHKRLHPDADRSDTAGMAVKQANPRKAHCYDIHVDSPTNLYLLANGMVTHNSGKSTLGARIVSWFFTNTHPYYTYPASWRGPLTIMVIGRTLTQVEEELWEKKIKPFLTTDCYTEHRLGGALTKVMNPKNGNRILFFSHHNSNDAREKVQSFVANVVWLDELPESFKLLEELHRRLMKSGGPLVATYTPKIKAPEIQRYVEKPSTTKRVYKLKMLSNPIYVGRESELLESMSTMSESYRRTILDGDWTTGDNQVYEFADTNIANPPDYLPVWRHVVSVDPAAAGLMGLTVWAEDPHTSRWYCVVADYLKGAAPSDLIETVEQRVRGMNVWLRVTDAAPWYVKEAHKHVPPLVYRTVNAKHDRKTSLVKGLQQALSDGRVKIAPSCGDLLAEFQRCQYSESGAKIVDRSRWHLLDSAQYFVDTMPRPIPPPAAALHPEVEIRQAFHARQAAQAAKSQPRGYKIASMRGRRWA